jgi:hypothetical protein
MLTTFVGFAPTKPTGFFSWLHSIAYATGAPPEDITAAPPFATNPPEV